DYYTKTAFEVTSEYLGAQKAVAAGGRYDRLVEDFGGPPTHAIGFAVGMERVVTLLKEVQSRKYPSPTLFIATIGREAELEGLRIAEDIRARGFWVEPNYGGVSLRSQLRKADRIGAEFAFIIGSDELRSGKIKWKELKNGKQGEVEIDNATKVLSNNIESPDP
ncbi:His/Gly/Thr/Pro-type tRNA ligase C-terminal domain-containing protein, partial [Thermodesulfovibrionales bacterium]|nr:His/Gly/Thr/Pro-type tRNA ligase C-terminal domain-containing protein [Thermodesulfovibrionales bacterium]